ELKMRLDGEFATPLTDAFTDVSLEEGIRRLARGHSVSFAYAPPRGGGDIARLSEGWVVESSPAARSPVAGDSSAPPAARGEPSQQAGRFATLRALGQRRDEAAVTELSQTLARDPDPAVRAQAAWVLGQIPGPPAVAALTAALGDETPGVRIRAIQGL